MVGITGNSGGWLFLLTPNSFRESITITNHYLNKLRISERYSNCVNIVPEYG